VFVSSVNEGFREFEGFRLDPCKKVLWFADQPVSLPLKEIELLSVLTANPGEVLTKNELLDRVWAGSFVEESNLSRHIYMLRKTFKQFGSPVLIETVPRRGYRFVGQVSRSAASNADIIIERRIVSHTTIEGITEDADGEQRRSRISDGHRRSFVPSVAISIVGSALVFGILAGYALWNGRAQPSTTAAGGIRSLAVLPFARLDSADTAGQEGVGLADALITRLSSLRSITVRPIKAVTDVDNSDPIAAGKRLGVDAVLVGSIYRSAETTHVNTRLLKTADGTAFWTGEFEIPAAEKLHLHDQIASRVSAALVFDLSVSEKSAISKVYTTNEDALHLYQRARFEWNKRNTAGATDAARLFRQAIEKDPQFSLALAGLAEVTATINATEAEAIARRAIEIDPDLPDAHAALGFIQTFVRRNWSEAERELKQAIDLNPNYAPAHHWYAELLAILGRNSEAKAAMNKALEIDPLSPNFLADLGQIYYFNREYNDAEIYCRRALEIDPNFSFAHEYLAEIHLRTGQFPKAVEARLAAEQINNRFSIDSAQRVSGINASIDQMRKISLEQGERAFLRSRLSGSSALVHQYYDARRYADLGEKEMALAALERSIDGDAFHTVFIKADPVFDPVRTEPRYLNVLQRLHLLESNN
jgi:DNA-binding winged helix-turn-helix (wHTH) protein/tetratricopeptide (TPR) repeat protein